MMNLNKVRDAVSFLLFVIFLTGCHLEGSDKQVCFKNHCVDVEVVQTQGNRMRGLQFRDSLGEDKGMLFIFPGSQRHRFWMKDTKIPLDIVWFDSAQRVVHIKNNIPPCQQDPCPTYAPPSEALYVLEVNAGHAKRMGLQKGDRLDLYLGL